MHALKSNISHQVIDRSHSLGNDFSFKSNGYESFITKPVKVAFVIYAYSTMTRERWKSKIVVIKKSLASSVV